MTDYIGAATDVIIRATNGNIYYLLILVEPVSLIRLSSFHHWIKIGCISFMVWSRNLSSIEFTPSHVRSTVRFVGGA
jgi:hypothetical protein